MKTVYGYRMPGWKSAPDLEGIEGKSFDSISKHLKEGDHVTVKVMGKGYKENFPLKTDK